MPQQILSDLQTKCQATIDFLHGEYAKLQTGRANAALVEGIMVESYGSKMSLKGVASISIPESNQIAIQPWNRDQLPDVEKALRNSDLGLNPNNDGVIIRLILPPMTEERRTDLKKLVHKYAEDARISVRNARHESMDELKTKEKSKEISEDELKAKEDEIQNVVDEINKKIENAATQKDNDIMTV